MEENNSENINSSNDTGGTVESNEEVVADTTNEESKPEYTEAERKAYARAKKAEQELKALKIQLAQSKEPKQEAQVYKGELGTKDLLAIIEAKVPTEDIDEVVEYAKFKKMSVMEALKSSTIKSILAEKAEQRKTASVANTGSTKRGSGKMTDEMLLENARNGKMPETEEDIARLYRIRKGIK